MVLCVPLTSADPGELATIIRPIDGDVVVTGRGTFRSSAVRINLHRVWMQHVEEALPRIWQAGGSPTRAAIWFLTEPGPAIKFQGTDAGASDIGICPIGQPIWQRLTGPSKWGSMSISLDDWASLSTVAGCDPFSSSMGMILTPNESSVMQLQRVHCSTSRLGYDAPELFDNAEVARGIEQSLIDAMLECLQPPTVASANIPPQRRAKIMRRFRDVIEECGDAPLYVPELCVRMGVPSRTLRTVCHEYLGIGPKKYLHLRRLHLVRRALRVSDSAKTTVTEVATQFGFWELGRFSVEYKALFGESPSGTLRHSA